MLSKHQEILGNQNLALTPDKSQDEIFKCVVQLYSCAPLDSRRFK